ncbi:acetate/propionate family kinase [Methyloterricola oryzae]|uniref:acetate/propionate family kinase n=1 Tax=Methyloterricola oryzae TaxID=1495050 RepID=UPI0005EB5B30|nr:acetate/propionate family kinase [Methyloterricola oryzae]
MSESPLIAVVNCGSATLKFSLLRDGRTLLTALADRLGPAVESGPRITVKDAGGAQLLQSPLAAGSHGEALTWLFQWLKQEHPEFTPAAVGHRVVHGGDKLVQPLRVDAQVLSEIEALVPLAPLHQPHNLAPIRFIAERFSQLPQVACFDTAFHASQTRIERLFALPRELEARGIRRYGFHGLSYEYIAQRLPELDAAAASGCTVVCHLGNGASLCAIRDGRSVASTMSFTALDGIPMGTRSGAVDPGVLLHLLMEEGMEAKQLHDLLYKRSGLLGLSGISSDMRDLLDSDRPEAGEAVEYFCYRIAREIGSLAAALGGLDCLVFTGGIGEHAAPVRARVGELCRWLGVEMDMATNEGHGTQLQAPGSRVKVLMIPANEEGMIAAHTARVLGLTVAR